MYCLSYGKPNKANSLGQQKALQNHYLSEFILNLTFVRYSNYFYLSQDFCLSLIFLGCDVKSDYDSKSGVISFNKRCSFYHYLLSFMLSRAAINICVLLVAVVLFK